MKIQDIRRQRLREWLEGRSAPAKEKSYFSQLVSGTASFGERAARRIESDYGMALGYLDTERISASAESTNKAGNQGVIFGSPSESIDKIGKNDVREFDKNVVPGEMGQRQIPVISYVQAGLMTEVVDPFALGGGFELIATDLDLSGRAFALIIDGPSMEPEFREGDKVIIDPAVCPHPGDFVVAKNSVEEATFKKYRPRSTDAQGNMIFELVPLNDDFPTLNSERDHLIVIGVMMEHRKYRRR